jgi:decaprenylphospho-beta-D-erythro-pentofuranosid-2-ulose 2-reductase
VPVVLILGATSGIARPLAEEFARRGYACLLTGRDEYETQALASDLALRYGVRAEALVLDVLDFASHQAVIDRCFERAGGNLAGAVLCIGYLGPTPPAEAGPAEVRRILDSNFTGCVSLLNLLATRLAQQQSGFICAISSVAGDRGRQSNFLYCAAKAGLTAYLQGLRNYLFRFGVGVITVKPGFVDTPMTYGRQGTFLVASPESVARGIYKAIERGQDVVYLPWFWRPIMFVVRIIPEGLFKRLRV